MREQVPVGFRPSRFEYQIKIALSKRYLDPTGCKYLTLDIEGLSPRIRFFRKAGFGRIIRALNGMKSIKS